MRTVAYGLALVLGCGLLFAGGCAKNEVVKKDEPVVAQTPPEPTPPTKQVTPHPPPETPQPAKPAETSIKSLKPQEDKSVAAMKEEAFKTKAEADLQRMLEKIYFDFDSSVLSDAARASLKNNYELMKKNSGAKVQIEGHCDERGSDEYNLALGDRRAKAAMSYLTTLGVKSDRMTTISYGKEKPADPGHDEAAWGKNRRDEFIVVK